MARPLEHGMSNTPTYRSWRSMLNRCNNPNTENYSEYGGRGITVCAGWHYFDNFYAYMGLRPEGCTVDRVDNNQGYQPGNCRWATESEQQRNKRPFKQPAGRTYGQSNCRHCGVPFIRLSPVAVNCPEHRRCRK